MTTLTCSFDGELKPCANCKGQPALRVKKRNRYFYECDGDCWARTPAQTSKEAAAKAWNAMQYNALVQYEVEPVDYDRATALAVLKEFSRDMYCGVDIFGNEELRISKREFEAIRKKYLG